MLEVLIAKCPTCSKSVIWDKSSLFRPFCSKRCQLIDLDAWVSEEKSISSEVGLFVGDDRGKNNLR